MVSKDKNLIFTAFQIVMPSFKRLYDGQELLIVGFVVVLNEDHLSREKSCKVPLTNLR